MAFKYVIFAAVVAVARASHNVALTPVAVGSHSSVSTYSTHQQHAPSVHTYAVPSVHAYAAPAVHAYAAPAVHAYAAPAVHAYAHEPTAPAHYDYGYGVSDPITGDHHSQQESRRGDAVQGSYSLIEADGSKRTVEYAADDHNGFNAVVHKEPAVTYAAHAPVVQAKLVAAAPSLVHGYSAHSVAAPSLVHGYSAHSVAAPSLVHGYSVAAPSYVDGYSAHSVAAPSLVHGYAASPVYASGYAAHSVVAPSLVKGYAGVVPALAHNVW